MLIALVGNAGSGKDTVGKIVADNTNARLYAFADPMKELISAIFGFTDLQLWGPSEQRNQPDFRYGRKWWEFWRRESVARQHRAAMYAVRTRGEETVCDLLPGRTRSDVHAAYASLVDWCQEILTCALEDGYLTPRKTLQSLGTEWGRSIDPDMWWRFTLAHIRRDQALHAVVTDCRFVNEAEGVRVIDGGLVWRVGRPGCGGGAGVSGGISGHASELEQNSAGMDAWITSEIDNSGSLLDLRGVVVRELRRVALC